MLPISVAQVTKDSKKLWWAMNWQSYKIYNMLIFLWIVDHFVESRFLFKNKNSFRTESLLPILLAQVARYEMEILILPNILFYFLFILLDFRIREFCFQGQKHKKKTNTELKWVLKLRENKISFCTESLLIIPVAQVARFEMEILNF